MERPAIDLAAESFAYSGAFAPGEVIGSYEILSLIGRGGMGEVYLAQDRQLHRRVALKLVRRGMDTDHIVRRFLHEQQLLASLNHPNIAQLYEAGVTPDGIPFFAMEYVDGTRIDDYCRENNLTIERRLDLFGKVCAAIHYAHQHLVVHRDIKPSNILVTADVEPKLLDFGIAKLLDAVTNVAADQTITLQNVLTPDYASPEHVRGEPITTASDVYSLGVLLYELLTETKPYKIDNRSPVEIARIITECEPTKPSAAAANFQSQISNPKLLRGDLDNIVLMAMRKEPQRRYSSVAQFAGDIRRHLDGLPVRARKDTVGYRASKFVQRNRAGVVAAVLVLSALLAATFVSLAQKRTADRRFNDVRQMANSLLFEVEGELEKGPTKAREKLITHAVTYLDRLATEVRNDPALQVEVAAGYLKVGDIQGRPFYANTGDKAAALASYGKAVDILEPLASSSRASREALRYLSQAWQSIARVHRRDWNWSEALSSARQAVALAEKLLQSEPTNDAYRALLADDYIHLGTALFKTEYAHTVAELNEALSYYDKALLIHRDLMKAFPQRPEYRAATAADHFWVGAALERLACLTGKREYLAPARDNFHAQVELNAALLALDPSNNRYRRAWADAVLFVGNPPDALGDPSERLSEFQEAFSVIQSIAAADPANVEARRDVATGQRTLADAFAAAGDLATAVKLAREAVANFEALQREDPNTGESILSGMLAAQRIAVFEKALGHYEAALAAYERTLRLADGWHGKHSPSIPSSRLTALTYVDLGELHEAMCNWPAAKTAYEHSQTFWQKVPDEVLPPSERATKHGLHDRVLRCEHAMAATD